MKTMLIAAAAMLSIGIGSAFAASEGGTHANTFFTELPGVMAHAPAQNAPAVATARNGQAVQTYITRSNQGTWFSGGNQGGDGTQG
jgi:hypothetical protein